MDLHTLRHVAELAELSLSAEEEAKMADEIGKILAYVAELGAVDTSSVAPTAQLASGGEDAWRADAVQPGVSREEALRGAPRAEHDGFSVPAFVE